MNGARSLGSGFRIGSIVLALAVLAPCTLPTPAAERSEAPDRPATRASTRPSALKLPAIGDRLEVKWGGFWNPASVKNKSPKGWILVQYDREKTFEWVEPWRVRKIGSDYQLDHASPNRSMFKPEPPPNDPPSLAPPNQGWTTRAEAPQAATSAPAVDANANGNATKTPAAGGDVTVPAAPVALPLTKVVDSATPQALAKDAPAWKLTPDLINPSPKPADQRIELKGGSREFFETSQLLLPRGSSETALIAYIDAPPGKPPTARCERVDLNNGTTSGTMLLPAASEPLDLSPNGQLLLGRSSSRQMGERDRIDLWTLAPTAAPPKHQLSFKPYDTENWAHRDLEWAAFADDSHVLTINRDSRLTCWDIAGGREVKSLWSVPLSRFTSRAILSGTRKYLVALDDTGIVFLDPLQGTLLARLSDGPANPGDFALSDDGKQLVGLSGDTVAVWDLTTGKLARQPVLLPHGSAGAPVAFANDPNYILLGGGRHLLDLDRRIILWEYELAMHGSEPPAQSTWAGRFWQLIPAEDKTASPKLINTILPHDAAKQLASALKPDDLLLIKPGVTVTLEVNIEASEQQRQQVIDSLKARLRANNITVADAPPTGAPGIKLVAATLLGESTQRTYEHTSTGKQQQVTITPHITRLAFETSDGTIAWEARTANSAGLMLSIKDGQSAQSVADAGSQYNIPFLMSCPIPAYVTQPRDPIAFGTSPLPVTPAASTAPVAAPATQKLRRPLPSRLRK